jgi:hypothetical protein
MGLERGRTNCAENDPHAGNRSVRSESDKRRDAGDGNIHFLTWRVSLVCAAGPWMRFRHTDFREELTIA